MRLKLFLDDLRLSPYTYSVSCALLTKGVSFDSVEVSFGRGESLTAGFRERSATDLIPLVEDGEWHLSESLAILEYLEDRFPAPEFPAIFPRDLRERAEARMLLSWFRTGFTALRNDRSAETVFYRGSARDGMKRGPLSDEARGEIRELIRHLEKLPSAWRTENLFGAWSIADAETALMLQRVLASADVDGGDLIPERWRRYVEYQWQREHGRDFINFPRKTFRSFYAD